MSILKQLFAFLILAVLAVFIPSAIFGCDFQQGRSGGIAASAFAYGEQTQTITAYDAPSSSALNYDFASVIFACEKGNRTPRIGGAFTGFAKFQAAEGASLVPQSYMNSRLLVNMEPARKLAGSTLNASGEVRNASYFWQQLIEREPQMFSKGNLYRVQELELSPRVDATWVKYNSTHQSFMDDVLAHHHIKQGPIAVPLPQTVHEKWTSVLHGN